MARKYLDIILPVIMLIIVGILVVAGYITHQYKFQHNDNNTDLIENIIELEKQP